MDLLDKFYSTATEELLADCVLVQLVLESLGIAQAIICFAYNLMELALHLQGPVYLVHNLLGLLQHLLHPVYLSMTCWNVSNIFCTPFILSTTCWSSLTSSTPCLSCPWPAGTSLTSFAACSSCPQPAEASPRQKSSSDILLLVLLSLLTEGCLFTLTVEALFGCDKGRVCNIGEEDPLAWCRSASGSHCLVTSI